MVDYEKLYKILFNGITDAIRNMDELKFAVAKHNLIKVQREAEIVYIQTEADE